MNRKYVLGGAVIAATVATGLAFSTPMKNIIFRTQTSLFCESEVILKGLASPSSYKLIDTRTTTTSIGVIELISFDASNRMGAIIRETALCAFKKENIGNSDKMLDDARESYTKNEKCNRLMASISSLSERTSEVSQKADAGLYSSRELRSQIDAITTDSRAVGYQYTALRCDKLMEDWGVTK